MADILSDEWILSAVAGWVVLFLLIDWKEMRVNIWVGIAACIIQVIHDSEQVFLNNYEIHGSGLLIIKSPLLFTFGVVFTMGVVFSQFLPRNKILKIVHILAFSFGFLAFEYLAVNRGLLKYIHFSRILSFPEDIMVITTLAWIKSFILWIYN